MSFWSATRWRQHVALRHATDHAVMLVETPAGWELPLIEAEPSHPGDLNMLTTGMRERFGIEITPLRCLAHEFDPETRIGEWVREVECANAAWRPLPPARWVTLGELECLKFVRPAHRAVLSSWLSERGARRVPEGEGEPQRVLRARRVCAWQQRGWRDRAVAWIETELRRRALGDLDHVEQVRAWEFSVVLELTAGPRRFYFKAVQPRLGREIRLTTRLSERNPGTVANVIAADPTQGWILMAEVEGTVLENIRDVSRWEAAARAYARLQIDWIDARDELIGLGCRELRPTYFTAQLIPCLDDPVAMAPGLRRDLTTEEIARLRALAPALGRASAELEACGIPSTLDHGDLWASNVIDTAEGPVLLDWEDACVGHPFFALWHLILSAEDWLKEEDAAGRIREAYLEPWTRYASLARLREAFDLAQRVAPLTYAITFREEVLPVLDASWELREFVSFFLRRLLAAWK